MPYLFGTGTGDPQAWPGETLRRYWLNFIRSGDPNGAGLPRWDGAMPGAQRLLLVQDQARTVNALRPAAVAFWHHRWQQESGSAILP